MTVTSAVLWVVTARHDPNQEIVMSLMNTLRWFNGFDGLIVAERNSGNDQSHPMASAKPNHGAGHTPAINRSLRSKKFGKKLWGV